MRDIRVNEIVFKSYINKLHKVLSVYDNEDYLPNEDYDSLEILKNVITEMEEDLKKA